MSFLEELPVLAALTGGSGLLEKPASNAWAKMPWAAHALSGGASGAVPPSFSEGLGGSYFQKESETTLYEFKGANQCFSIKCNIGSDIAERYIGLDMCINAAEKNYYRCKFYRTSASEMHAIIYKVEKGTEKELGTGTTFAPEAGDEFAFWKVGKTLEAWRRPKGEGAWVKVASFSDTGTEYTIGFAGVEGSGADPALSNFSGGVEKTGVKITPSASEGKGGDELKLTAPAILQLQYVSFETLEYAYEGLTFTQLEALFGTFQQLEESLGNSHGQARPSLTLHTRFSLGSLSSAGQSGDSLTVKTGAPISGTSEGQSGNAAKITTNAPITASAAGQSGASLSLTAPSVITPGTSAGQSGDSLAITARAFVVPGEASGVGSDALALNAPTQVPLLSSEGISSATLSFTAPTSLGSLASEGKSSGTLSIHTIAPLIGLEAGGLSAAELAIFAATRVALEPSEGVSTASGTITTNASLTLVSEGSSTASAQITVRALLELESDGSSGDALTVTTIAPIAGMTAAGLGSGSLVVTTVAPIEGSSAGEGGATITLGGRPMFALESSGQGSGTLSLRAPVLLMLASAGESAATLTLDTGASIAGTSSGHGSDSLALDAPAFLRTLEAAGISTGGTRVTTGALIVGESTGTASSSLSLRAATDFTLASEGDSAATLEIGTRTSLTCSSAGTSEATAIVSTTAPLVLLSSEGVSSATLALNSRLRIGFVMTSDTDPKSQLATALAPHGAVTEVNPHRGASSAVSDTLNVGTRSSRMTSGIETPVLKGS